MLDYFVYNVIGKQFCKEILCEFQCDVENHTFKWHSSRNRTCQICYTNGIRNKKATLIKKILPCTDNDGSIAIRETDFVRSNIADPNYDTCPFREICISADNMGLNSQIHKHKGQTEETAYARKSGRRRLIPNMMEIIWQEI